jgi:hypothetical protein
MEKISSSRLSTTVALLETLVTFIAAIGGNKIAEYINVSPTIVGVMTIICLLILSIISYIKTHDFSATPIKELKIGITFGKFIPKTIIAIFPFGLIFGFGAATLFSTTLTSVYYRILFSNLFIYGYDFWGIVLGVVFCILFAILLDSPLAGGISAGYGIAFGTGLSLFKPYPVLYNLFSYGIGFIIFAILLVMSESIFIRLRQIITEPRL